MDEEEPMDHDGYDDQSRPAPSSLPAAALDLPNEVEENTPDPNLPPRPEPPSLPLETWDNLSGEDEEEENTPDIIWPKPSANQVASSPAEHSKQPKKDKKKIRGQPQHDQTGELSLGKKLKNSSSFKIPQTTEKRGEGTKKQKNAQTKAEAKKHLLPKKTSLEAEGTSTNTDSVTIEERKEQTLMPKEAKKKLMGLEKGFEKRVWGVFRGCKNKDEVLEKLKEGILDSKDLSNLSVQAGLRQLCDYELVQLILLAKNPQS